MSQLVFLIPRYLECLVTLSKLVKQPAFENQNVLENAHTMVGSI